MNPDLRLQFLKLLVNIPLRLADRILPEVEEEKIQFPQTQMLLRASRIMLKAYKLEVLRACLDLSLTGILSVYYEYP